jgi:hypothetical protein
VHERKVTVAERLLMFQRLEAQSVATKETTRALEFPGITALPLPDKFYKRGSQEKSLSHSRMSCDSPAHVMKEGFVLALPRDWLLPS